MVPEARRWGALRQEALDFEDDPDEVNQISFFLSFFKQLLRAGDDRRRVRTDRS